MRKIFENQGNLDRKGDCYYTGGCSKDICLFLCFGMKKFQNGYFERYVARSTIYKSLNNE